MRTEDTRKQRTHVYRKGWLCTVVYNGEMHETECRSVPTAKNLKDALDAITPEEGDTASTIMMRAMREANR